MPAKPEVQESDFQPWESDHTALVHVLWDYGIKGEKADDLASKIMRSRWMKATRAHVVERAEMVPREVAESLAGALATIAADTDLYNHPEDPAEGRAWRVKLAHETEREYRAVFPEPSGPSAHSLVDQRTGKKT